MSDSSSSLEDNFLFFKSLLVNHSVQRPPFSIQVFSLEDVKLITDYVTHTYFRQFKLYRYIFTKKSVLDVHEQTLTLDTAPALPPLYEAMSELQWQRLYDQEHQQDGAANEDAKGAESSRQDELSSSRRTPAIMESLTVGEEQPHALQTAPSTLPLPPPQRRSYQSLNDFVALKDARDADTPATTVPQSNTAASSTSPMDTSGKGSISVEISRELAALASTAVSTQLEKLKAEFERKLKVHEDHLAERLQLLESKTKAVALPSLPVAPSVATLPTSMTYKRVMANTPSSQQ